MSTEIDFSDGREWGEVQIEIIDDEQWEPDKEFKVCLFDLATQEVLDKKDTKCTVLILDDDKPGFLSFGSKTANIKHIATEEICKVTVHRTKGSDGKISCKWRTVQLANQVGRVAEPDKDFIAGEGTLDFKHNEIEKEIEITIVKHEVPEGETAEERDEIFGV